jgi:hypothetical protein
MQDIMTPAQVVAAIRADWTKPYFGAVPYLEALECLDSWTDRYGCEDATFLAAYLLSNLRTYRGANAKAVRATLKAVTK